MGADETGCCCLLGKALVGRPLTWVVVSLAGSGWRWTKGSCWTWTVDGVVTAALVVFVAGWIKRRFAEMIRSRLSRNAYCLILLLTWRCWCSVLVSITTDNGEWQFLFNDLVRRHGWCCFLRRCWRSGRKRCTGFSGALSWFHLTFGLLFVRSSFIFRRWFGMSDRWCSGCHCILLCWRRCRGWRHWFILVAFTSLRRCFCGCCCLHCGEILCRWGREYIVRIDREGEGEMHTCSLSSRSSSVSSLVCADGSLDFAFCFTSSSLFSRFGFFWSLRFFFDWSWPFFFSLL